MKVAIIGGGAAGMGCAYLLDKKHEVGISSNELLRIQSWIYFTLLLLIAHHSKKINFNRILKKSKIFLKKLIFLLKLLILILITNF